MTVISKSTFTGKKYPLIEEGHGDDEVDLPEFKRTMMNTAICMGFSFAVLILIVILVVLQLFGLIGNGLLIPNRHYQGFCSVPLTRDVQFMEARKLPLDWKSSPFIGATPDIQVVSMIEEDPDSVLDMLREVLDINIDESVEKIAVYNNGHPVSFIHDFGANMTAIVDSDRCFTMDMDPELVLEPELFVVGLQRGDDFDVSRVRSSLRVVLPAPRAPTTPSAPSAPAPRPTLLRYCGDRPIYQLAKDTGAIIRKREVDAPPHDYIQFAGKHLQEIEISNLAELLEYEQNQKVSA